MGAFGLGLVLNFTDNATAGINKVSNTFNLMSQNADAMVSSVEGSLSRLSNMGIIGSTLMQFGDTMQSAGAGILNTYEKIGNKITSIGMDMYSARAQLTSLYGGADPAEEQLNNIMTYARKSVFAYQDVLKAVIMMKANGIEALEEVTSTSGKSTQKLMDYASDLAAFNPQMRNSYGTGVRAAMGAINEYIAEGNAISLKRGASLDINSILGEDKGATIEERTRQIADLMEKLNMVGLTAGLAGTPMQQLSNMGDLVFQTFSKISDNGVFEKFSEILATLTTPIQRLADETDIFDRVARSLADAMLAIMNPIQKVAEYLATWIEPILELVAQHPKLVAMIGVIGGIAGVSLLAAGMLLKLVGSITMLQVSLGLLRLSGLGGIGIFKMMITAVGGLISAIAPFVAIAFLMYEAWTNNILGIRDALTAFIQDVMFLGTVLVDALSDDTISYDMWVKARDMGLLPFIETILDLKYNVIDFINGFKQGLQDIKSFVDQVANTMTPFGFTLKDITDKVTELLDKFVGFKFSSGWESAGKTFAIIGSALLVALPAIKIVSILFGAMTSPIGLIAAGIALVVMNFDKLKEVLGNIPGMIENLDLKSLGGYISAALLGLLATIKGGSFASGFASVMLGVFKGGFGLLMNLGAFFGPMLIKFFPMLVKGLWSMIPAGVQLFASLFAGVFTKMLPLFGAKVIALGGRVLAPILSIFGGLGAKLLPLLLKVGGTLLGAIGAIFGPIISAIGGVPLLIGGAIIAAIAVVVALITNNGEGIKNAFEKIWNAIPEPIQGVIIKVGQMLSGLANKLIDALGLRPLMNTIQQNLPQIIQWFSNLGNQILGIFSKLITWVKGAWDGWLGDLIRNIGSFVGNVITIVGGLLAVLIPIVMDLISGILDVVLPIVDGIGAIINDVMDVVNGILEFIIGVFTGDWGKAWDGVVSTFSGIFNAVKDIFKTVINAVIGLANKFIGALNKISIPGTDIGVNIPEIPLLNTGGYVEKEGAAVLHPSEIVVNAPMTKKLDEFLNNQDRAVPNAGAVPTQVTPPAVTADSHDDYSVKFEQGSIVIQAQKGMSEAEMRQMAETIMKYAERKREIDAMARKPKKEVYA